MEADVENQTVNKTVYITIMDEKYHISLVWSKQQITLSQNHKSQIANYFELEIHKKFSY